MGKLKCICNKWTISDVGDPCSEKGWFISDNSLNDNPDVELFDIVFKGREVFECQECGAIAFGHEKHNTVKWYKPIDVTTDRICGGR